MEVVELWRCVERESGQKAKSERDEKRCGAPRHVGQSREQCAALGRERERGSLLYALEVRPRLTGSPRDSCISHRA